MRDLLAKHNANLEALNAAAEAAASKREAKLAQTLQPLKMSLQKAVDDFEPETCEKIQTEIDEAKAAAASATAIAAAAHGAAVANASTFHETCAAKLEALLAAQAALVAAESSLTNTPGAAGAIFEAAKKARAAALEAAAERKLVEAKEAMSASDFTKAKTFKADADNLRAQTTTAAAGKDNAGKEERQQMEVEARALESAVACARTELTRCEEALALLPETADAFACAAVDRPMGSTWCWTSSNDNIAAGDVGTVVGILHGHGKVEVKFSQVTWPLAPDQLIPPEEWQEREAVHF